MAVAALPGVIGSDQLAASGWARRLCFGMMNCRYDFVLLCVLCDADTTGWSLLAAAVHGSM